MSQLTETETAAETVTVTLKRIRCRHVHADARQCGSPALHNEQFCYYHHDTRRPVVRPHDRLARTSTFSLFTPGDFDAIQESLGELLIRIASNDIDPRRAGLLLYCLQISSANLRIKQQAQRTSAGDGA